VENKPSLILFDGVEIHFCFVFADVTFSSYVAFKIERTNSEMFLCVESVADAGRGVL